MSAPITALFAALYGILIVILAFRISKMRMELRVDLGWENSQALFRAVRIHGNAIEYIPIALILMLTYELNTHHEWLLYTLGTLFLIARLAHVWGLSRVEGPSAGRALGAVLTYAVILCLGLANLWVYVSNP